jgi:AcrR family transcriptional regulator
MLEDMPEVAAGRNPAGGEVAVSPSENWERLTDAATRIATERGYEAVDPEQVARSAGLAVDDFYSHFDSVDQCMLSAFDRFLGRMLDEIEEACEGTDSWPDEVKATIGTAFEFVAELEPVARVFAVDATRTGSAGIERRCASIERAARRLKEGRLLYPRSAEYPDAMEGTLVAGVVMIVSSHLLGEEAGRLPTVESEVVEMLLTPYIGGNRARLVADS